MKTNAGVVEAIRRVGSGKSLADKLGVAPPSVCQWRTGLRKVPFERCLQIEAITGVPAEELRPGVLWHIYRK